MTESHTLMLEETLRQSQRRNAELEADGERLEFVISVLNCWDKFCDFVNEWHPTRRTTVRRAESAEWRAVIDAARKQGGAA